MRASRKVPFLTVAAACLLAACTIAPRHEIQVSDLVAIGDSMTMGIQDAGLVRSYQLNCYPYLVAKQMGQAAGFQQPLVASPGIGVPPYERPLTLEYGQVKSYYLPEGISETELLLMVLLRLENAGYRNPYNNLGVNGARLHDLRFTTGYDHTFYNVPNFFYDITLRNQDLPFIPNFGGMTMVQEAALLEPAYILLWIGNNDALGYVLGGGDDPTRTLTDPEQFEEEYRNVLSDLRSDTPDAKIVIATIPEYLPFGYALDSVFTIEGGTKHAKLFDPKTFLPIDFDDTEAGVLYIDLYLEDDDGEPIEHLLLTAAAAYLEQGAGIPAGLTELQKEKLAECFGVAVSELPVPPAPGWLTKDLVFTHTEEQNTLNAIHAFSQKIWLLAAEFSQPVVDANSFMKPGGWSDDKLKFALVSQDSTAYSLDGIHPNNYGHALITNEFIAGMNSAFGLSIPALDPENYRGQYSGKSIRASALKSIQGLREMYLPRK